MGITCGLYSFIPYEPQYLCFSYKGRCWAAQRLEELNPQSTLTGCCYKQRGPKELCRDLKEMMRV